ncbi:MAG: hypothetical protein NT062_05020 [Proteobacteria bacterium]|nr:hypothetical protein [Pseudomonadota bacterium]
MWRCAVVAIGMAIVGCKARKVDEDRAPPVEHVPPVAPVSPPQPGPVTPVVPIEIGKPCAAQQSELVYVLTNDDQLMSFDPQKLPDDPFHLIAQLSCGLLNPNSMAIDHFGVAWIVDHHRTLFRASILDGRCEQAEALTGDAIPQTFGMGFAANGTHQAAGSAETLYVASDDTNGVQPSVFATLDTTKTRPAYAAIGKVAARGKWNPEFSGTGDGELFGYFPLAGGDGFVQQIDRASGAAIGKQWTVPSPIEVQSWAFAQWGGKFYIFTTLVDGNSVVHEIRRKTGEYKVVREHLPFAIIGAGVSTCAPVLEAL